MAPTTGDQALDDYRDVDYFNDLSLVNDPYPYFEYLRSVGPVVFLPKHNVIAVTGYDEGVAVLMDHDTFSSINSATGPLPPLPFKPKSDDITEQIRHFRSEMSFGAMLVTQDPPEHTRSRSLLMGLLTPNRLQENEQFIHIAAERKIAEFIDRGGFEAVSEFARPMATLTIADLLGVPEKDHLEFCSLFGPLPGQIGGDVPLANNPMTQVAMHFSRYIEARRREPRNDVMTRLAQAKYPDGVLPDIAEIVGHAAVLFGAGQDTTVRLIAATLRTLSENPALQRQVREDRSRIPNLVEEVLRLDGPTKAHFRLAKRHAKIGDVDVVPGTTVMLVQSAMSRDPRRFEAPNEFHLDRKNRQTQLAFGRGIHNCVGAPLARKEAKLALEHLFDRIADFRIDDSKHGPKNARQYEYEPNYTQRALCAVHIEFTKA
jgi:cytochrome P450